MKPLVALFVALLALPSVATAADDVEWPGTVITRPVDGALRLPANCNAQLPEQFDWQRYISENGNSTIEAREHALMACSVLWKRLLEVESEIRDRWTQAGHAEQAKSFDVMQRAWRQLCASECRYMTGPKGEPGGSGMKAFFPTFVAEQIQTRIKWLTAERW